MLILTRRIGESVVVGNNVTLTVLGVKGNQVRVGVDAPQDVSVHRKEIYMKIEEENTVKNSLPDECAKNKKPANNKEPAKNIDISDVAGTLSDEQAKFMENEIKQQHCSKITPVIIRRKRRLTISTENNNDAAGNK